MSSSSGRSRTQASVARRTGGVAFAYGASILLLLLGELRLAHHISSDEFGVYGLVKQAIPLVAALGLLGYDQALTRESAAVGHPTRFNKRQAVLALRTGALATAFGGYLAWGLGTPLPAAAALVLAATSVTVSNLVSGVMRATGLSFSAAIGQQGYRLFTGLMFVAVPASLPGVTSSWVTAGTATAVALGCLVWSRKIFAPWTLTPQTQKLLTRLGYAYALGMLSMAAADWLDQAMVAQWAGLAETGSYAQTKLVSVYPLLSLGSILGFVALPAIAARRSTLTTEVFRRWWRLALAATLACLLICAPVAVLAARHLVPDPLGTTATLLLVTVGALRLLYVLPSAVLGAVASVRHLTRFGLVSLAGVAAQLVVTLAASPLGWTVAAAVGLLTSTLIRLSASAFLCFQGLRDESRRNRQTQESTTS